MRLLVRTTSNHEDEFGDCHCAVITLDEEDVKTILAKRELFQMVKTKEVELCEMSFWGCWVHYYSGPECVVDFVPAKELVKAPANMESHDYVEDLIGNGARILLKDEGELPDGQRTECDRILIIEKSFNFTCYPKHTGITIETESIPYEELLK